MNKFKLKNRPMLLILAVLFTMIATVAISGSVMAADTTYDTSNKWNSTYEDLENNLTIAEKDSTKANETVQKENKTLADKDKNVQTLEKKQANALSDQKKVLNTRTAKYNAYKKAFTKYKSAYNKYVTALKKYKAKPTKTNKNKALKAKKTAKTYKNKARSAKNEYNNARYNYESSKRSVTQLNTELSSAIDLLNYYQNRLTKAEYALGDALWKESLANRSYNNAKSVVDGILGNFTESIYDIYNTELFNGNINDVNAIDPQTIAENVAIALGLDPNDPNTNTDLYNAFIDSFVSNFTKILAEENSTNMGNDTFFKIASDTYLTNYTNVVMNSYFADSDYANSGYFEWDNTAITDYITDVITGNVTEAYNKGYGAFVNDATNRSNASATNATIAKGQELIDALLDAVNNVKGNASIVMTGLGTLLTNFEAIYNATDALATAAGTGSGQSNAISANDTANQLLDEATTTAVDVNAGYDSLNAAADNVTGAKSLADSATTIADILASYNQALSNATIVHDEAERAVDAANRYHTPVETALTDISTDAGSAGTSDSTLSGNVTAVTNAVITASETGVDIETAIGNLDDANNILDPLL
ncbi:chromosome partition protein Smc [Methanobrevibacter cuticularis]|uniref:Chromosome partition protein Smc n=1 Tax=Methanobrevibacter cuticularis TaxID=47311 RepID=A0A166CYI1_9EURY|nr:hypothetical protein [Methanobrevibacter cuticularis]KZX15000.1 chromosome partition protein Smc [Methanobrevibacter cuticularis]